MKHPSLQRIDATDDRLITRHPEAGHGADAGVRLHRPVFLDLMRIQMPVGAVTSIGHRISGVVLAASVPVAAYLLGLSLRDEAGFARVTALFGQFAVKAATVLVVWALAQHVLGGVRHLLSDFDVGSPLRVARRSAWFVNLAGVAVALFAAGVLW
ncbi:MAG: succinate dehydrogenase, cytochrome b556 subunit [Caldimonas sp.]